MPTHCCDREATKFVLLILTVPIRMVIAVVALVVLAAMSACAALNWCVLCQMCVCRHHHWLCISTTPAPMSIDPMCCLYVWRGCSHEPQQPPIPTLHPLCNPKLA